MSSITLPKRAFSFVREPLEQPPVQPLPLPPLPFVLSEALPIHVQEAIETGWQSVGRGGLGYLEEIRLRAGRSASLTVGGRNVLLPLRMTTPELFAILTKMCGGSLYAYSDSINEGKSEAKRS